MKPSLWVCRGRFSSAFLRCASGSHLSHPQLPKVAIEYGPFQRAQMLQELAGLILHCTFLRWKPFFLLAQHQNASLRELGSLGGLRRITHQDASPLFEPQHATKSQSLFTTYPPSPYSMFYLKLVSGSLWLALVVGLKSYLPRQSS